MTTSLNLFADIPRHIPEELFQALLVTDSVRIERIVSKGHVSPPGFWYDQEMHEWVLLLQGAARLQFDGKDETMELTAGASCNIPAHQRHRVAWTDPEATTIWLAVHYR